MNELTNVADVESNIIENMITLAYFSTEQCSVCKALKPKVQALAESYDNVETFYAGIDKLQELSGKYMVFSVPTIILFIEGREYKRFARYVSLDEIAESIDRYIELSN